jgi:type IV secretory pathway TrbL component
VLDKLAEVVAQTLLLLCLLVLLVIGLPFLSGFIAGRATARRSQPPAGPTAR